MHHTKILAALAVTGFVANAPAAHAETYPKPLEIAIRAGAQVVKSFPAASQLKGWVLTKDGQYSIVFTTPDNKTLIAGDLISEAGQNLTEQYADKYVPKPDLSALYPQLDKTGYITEGATQSPKSVIYIFFDPNCPFCHLTWKALQPYEKVGLQVRWVPVAYLKPDSVGKAAAIMEAKDKTAAFRENEMKYDGPADEGGVKALPKPSAATAAQLQSNMVLMQKFGAFGTPALIWKDKNGHVQMKAGLPRLSEIPAITGLPEQKVDDPELARFR